MKNFDRIEQITAALRRLWEMQPEQDFVGVLASLGDIDDPHCDDNALLLRIQAATLTLVNIPNDDLLRHLLSFLTPREEQIFRDLSGFGGTALTKQEVATRFACTPERISQIAHRTIKKIIGMAQGLSHEHRSFLREQIFHVECALHPRKTRTMSPTSVNL